MFEIKIERMKDVKDFTLNWINGEIIKDSVKEDILYYKIFLFIKSFLEQIFSSCSHKINF